MYNRHNEVPQLDTWESQVDAHYFNHVQRALKRMGKEIRLELPGLKHLDLILQKDAWIIVDRVLNDYPIAVWCDFETDHRDNLHEAIRCNLRSFHYGARMVMTRTLDAMEKCLIEELDKLAPEEAAHVIPFRKDSGNNPD
jgi:hypothetical protein